MAAKSDLGVRTLSAIVMLAVAGGALWLGGPWLDGFIVLVALGAFVEFVFLVLRATDKLSYRTVAAVAGTLYFGIAAFGLVSLDPYRLLIVLGAVILTDIGAYFTGRAIGGPKIAPRISPSKTWAGLGGGMIAAGLFLGICGYMIGYAAEDSSPYGEGWGLPVFYSVGGFLVGALLAIVAQAGDFFESWLKRKAGVKDSSRLIPGHGGIFDRVDGLLAVALVVGLFTAILVE